MNRRDCLKYAAGAAASFAMPGPRGSAATAERPNILLFIGDDWGRHASCYRDSKRPDISETFRTPNIDRVAKEGVLFTNAFVSAPSCTPSRAAIATGCHFWRSGRTAELQGGAWDGFDDPGDKLRGAGRMLEESGYTSRTAYKTLDRRWAGNGTQRRGLTKRAQSREDVARIKETARTDIRNMFSERKGGSPFHYVYGPIDAHRPWVAASGRTLWDLDPNALKGKLPKFVPDVPEIRADVTDYMAQVLSLDAMIGIFLEELERAKALENTMIVLSGDNGMGGMPRGKCNLYDFGVSAPLMIRWPAGCKGGRVVDDFVSYVDLAPTFVEAAGLRAPSAIDGRSLMPLLTSTAAGWIDRSRDCVYTGRERHVTAAREGRLPYPSRAIRTKDFLYIRNFKPDRWPMGTPFGLDGTGTEPAVEDIATNTHATLRDHDASPTKAWMVAHRQDTAVKPLYDLAFARRPAEELYELRTDPDQIKNVAGVAKFAKDKVALSDRLMGLLKKTNDPRLTDAFDRPPYVEPQR